MIVVEIKLVSAITGQTSQLGQMIIVNDGKSIDANYGDYQAVVLRKPNFQKMVRETKVVKHPRLQKTIWHLVGKALKQMGYVE